MLLSFLPRMPTVLTLVFEALILHEFGRDLRLRLRVWDYVWLVLSTPFYQALLAFAALRACVTSVRARRFFFAALAARFSARSFGRLSRHLSHRQPCGSI